MTEQTVLDATTGGKHIWHGDMKDADRVVFVDRRAVPAGEIAQQPNWSVRPDIQADYRELPFVDGCFDLICFDPPHRVSDDGMESISGIIETKYGVLHAETWQDDLQRAFTELWRVLTPGGVLTMKWNDAMRSSSAILDLLPETPLYGTNSEKPSTETDWWVFHK